MIDTLEGEAVVDWGPLMRNTGTAEEPVMVADPGHLVFVLTDDTLGIDGWEQWQFVPDPWPHSFGGRVFDQLACEELAPVAPATIPDTVPAKLTKEEREAHREARDARRAANAAILEARTAKEVARQALDDLNAAIDGKPAYKQSLIAAIQAGTAKLATLRADRDAAVAIAQGDGTREEKQAARDLRDELNAQIDVLVADLANLRDMRDRVDGELADLRAQKPAHQQKLDDLNSALDQARIDRAATI